MVQLSYGNDMTQYIYIHGFGTTGAGSTKFKKLKAFADETNQKAFALEWNEHQDAIVNRLQKQVDNLIDTTKPVCIIGSSTGGNFALQLLDYFETKKIPVRFIVINPLLHVEQRKVDNHLFTSRLADQLKLPSEKAVNGVILLGKKDEVLDYEYTQRLLAGTNTIVAGDDWNHTLSNVATEEFIRLIRSVK